MHTGDRIKFFNNSEVSSYTRSLKKMGFKTIVDIENKEIVLIGSEMSAKAYSRRLKQAMIKRHWSTRDLAEQCEVTIQTAESWFHGERRPYKKTRIKIEELLGVKP